MTNRPRIFWQSRDGGHWHPIDIHPGSEVDQALTTRKRGEVYDDGSGWRYRWTYQ